VVGAARQELEVGRAGYKAGSLLRFHVLGPTATSSLPASSGVPVALGRIDASVLGEG
jgi:hypothetical protein